MAKWIASGLGAVVMLGLTILWNSLDSRITALEQDSLPTRERVVRVETKIDYLTELVKEIRARFDRGSYDSRPPAEGGRLHERPR